MEQVHLKQKKLPFALIKPTQTQPRENLYKVVSGTSTKLKEIEHWWTEAKGPLVVDLETNGTQAHDTNQKVVGVSFADERGAIYVDVCDSQDLWKEILVELYNYKTPLIAHNVAFDASWMTRDLITALGGWENTSWLDSNNMYTKWTYHNWYVCTYAAYKHLASEGFENQKWGLKDLQVQVLNWENRGDVEIEAWLMENGYTKGQGSKKKADKGEMWRVPYGILGAYGCKDTDSTWQFWEYVLKPLFDRFSTYKWYHHEPFMSCVTMHMRQQLSGMQLDRKQLDLAQKIVSTRRDKTLEEFLTHGKVTPLLREWNDKFIYESAEKEPPKHKTIKLGDEPPRFKKNGEESPVWRKWKEKEERANNPEVSGRWMQWEAKHTEIRNTQHFNLGSPTQLRWMFYDKLGYDPVVYTKGENPQPSTGKDALLGFGELGKVLKRYKDDVKLLGYIDKYLERMDSRDVLRVQMRLPGSLSGRLSGTGGVNIQQVANDYEVLSAFVAREGCKWIISDFAALEPVCLAECSRDKALLSVYGKDAKANDVYLFVGAQLDGMKQYFLPHGYDPYNPTPEAIKKCKKEAKNWRAVAKCLYLSSGYGAGPKKIRESLALSGIELSFQQVKDMHTAYWKLFSGIKQLEKFLQNQWEKNGGWFLNGIGRPVCVDQKVIKDCVNRHIQSTGHDNLLIYLWLLRKHMEAESIPFNPIIWDLHDAVFLEVPDEWVGRTKELINVVVLDEFNSLIGAKEVTLKLEANVVDTFAEDKVENLVEARERWALDIQMLDEVEGEE